MIKKTALFLVKSYRFFLPWRFFSFLSPVCRFQPTCSEYTYQAIDKYGILRGGFLSFRRIIKCHPWSEGGMDELDII